jgi:DNA-3-methyladenine glycosylase I
MAEVPAATATSTALAKALKAEGFGYCGPTIAYAFMQACGLVNDHLTCCHRHDAVAAMA